MTKFQGFTNNEITCYSLFDIQLSGNEPYSGYWIHLCPEGNFTLDIDSEDPLWGLYSASGEINYSAFPIKRSEINIENSPGKIGTTTISIPNAIKIGSISYSGAEYPYDVEASIDGHEIPTPTDEILLSDYVLGEEDIRGKTILLRNYYSIAGSGEKLIQFVGKINNYNISKTVFTIELMDIFGTWASLIPRQRFQFFCRFKYKTRQCTRIVGSVPEGAPDSCDKTFENCVRVWLSSDSAKLHFGGLLHLGTIQMKRMGD